MCNFFSCIVDKNKKVYWKEGINNHHELLEIFKISDNTSNRDKISFAKIEILPNKKYFEDTDTWEFTVDERVRPVWFSSAHEDVCRKALKEYSKTFLKSYPGNLNLRGYNHPLPEGLNSCSGDLNLRGYNHPLPEGFNSCGGDLDIEGYNHPLPEGFNSCGDLNLEGYNHPLPEGFNSCGYFILCH
jgi:hypothetical protein